MSFSVGDGATVVLYSDRHAYTVVAVSKSGKTITLQRDKATLLNSAGSGEPDALVFEPGGFAGHTSGVQRWAYEEDEDGKTIKASLRKDGRWRVSKSGERVKPGRHEHYDFNF